MQDVAELLSKELKEKGYCARDCRSNSADGKKKSPEILNQYQLLKNNICKINHQNPFIIQKK